MHVIGYLGSRICHRLSGVTFASQVIWGHICVIGHLGHVCVIGRLGSHLCHRSYEVMSMSCLCHVIVMSYHAIVMSLSHVYVYRPSGVTSMSQVRLLQDDLRHRSLLQNLSYVPSQRERESNGLASCKFMLEQLHKPSRLVDALSKMFGICQQLNYLIYPCYAFRNNFVNNCSGRIQGFRFTLFSN